jgi:integrase
MCFVGRMDKSNITLYGRLRLAGAKRDLRSPIRKKLHRPYGADATTKKEMALSAAEIQQVLLWIPDEYQALFTFVAMTGVRVGELLGLRWFNIDFGRGN